jgi:hypothetical protein
MHQQARDWHRTFDKVGGVERVSYVHKDGTIKKVWAPSTCIDMIQRHIAGGGTEIEFWTKLSAWVGEQCDQGEMQSEWANDCFRACEYEWARLYNPPEPELDLFAEVEDIPNLLGD